MEKQKAVLMIAAHCHPKILKLTIGSWLQTYDGSYDAEVYVGLHSNYHHYHDGLGDIVSMEGAVRISYVEEMDWRRNPDQMEWIMRYSEMHSRNLLAIMKKADAEGGGFTHAAILDNDLVFEQDFVKWAMERNADMVCSLLGDRDQDTEVRTELGMNAVFAPKPSAWHMVVHRRLFDEMLRRPELVKPGMFEGKMYDTAARALRFTRESPRGVVNVYESKELEKMVRHSWGSSFNYGHIHDRRGYGSKVERLSAEYDRRFPKGIDGLLDKLRR